MPFVIIFKKQSGIIKEILQKTFRIFFIFFLSILFYCSNSTSSLTQIQSLMDLSFYHTHEVQITYEDIQNGRKEYSTTQVLGHYHRIQLTEKEIIQLKKGIRIQKTTESAAGHTHVLTLQVFSF